MEIGIALVAGVIIGWLIEWVVDWQYWRRGIAGFYASEAELRASLSQTQDSLKDAQIASQQARGELGSIRAQVQAARVREADLQRRLDEAIAENEDIKRQIIAPVDVERSQSVSLKRDDLERIEGIGPVYEQKLFGAGVATYAQLAALTPDDLNGIIQPPAWQNIDFEAWIEEARRFAEVVVIDQLPYRLEEIRGIGPTYVKRLNANGITTFEQLAAVSEKRLVDIIKPAAWQKVDFTAWIRQARAYAALVGGDRPPLPLEEIKGIGPVSATRLQLAGISTFGDLARATPEELRDIIGRSSDSYADWIAQAKKQAAAMSDTVADTGGT